MPRSFEFGSLSDSPERTRRYQLASQPASQRAARTSGFDARPNFRFESYAAVRDNRGGGGEGIGRGWEDGLGPMDIRRFNYRRFGGLPRFNEARFS